MSLECGIVALLACFNGPLESLCQSHRVFCQTPAMAVVGALLLRAMVHIEDTSGCALLLLVLLDCDRGDASTSAGAVW